MKRAAAVLIDIALQALALAALVIIAVGVAPVILWRALKGAAK